MGAAMRYFYGAAHEQFPPGHLLRQAVEAAAAGFAGDRVSGRGRYFATDGAFLHTRPERRPPIYVSAFGSNAAGVAARWGDGLWTLADPESAPAVIDAYRSGCDAAGKEPGEII